jgi:hypothetical protein
MSGGHFEYKQYQVGELAEEINRIICKVYKTRIDIKDSPDDPSDPNYVWDRYYLFTDETITKLIEARDTLRKAAEMAQRVDWLISGDDGEESFHRRWEEEGLNKNNRAWSKFSNKLYKTNPELLE